MKKMIGIGLILALFIPLAGQENQQPSSTRDRQPTLPLQEQVVIYIEFRESPSLDLGLFDRPFEVMVVVFKDNLQIITTIQSSILVLFPFRALETLKLKISDIAYVIHSHPVSGTKFTFGDTQLYKKLVSLGLGGNFLLYHNESGRILKLD